ncbi:hypothetical protein [Roseovarius sp.]|uniref:hypothetical protein n=1 Tax=Roseovarius sp. TaxID=1486281 RepID=UPI00257A102B|nr:hypothetical protein [Roseovarius sp.]
MKDKVVVSLSTIPPRFTEIGSTLKRLLAQNRPADEIHLYIPKQYRRFPEHAFCLPDVPEGVSVKVTDLDLGPATKVLPCARAHWGTATRIVYCDDDRLPTRDWLSTLLEASETRPADVIVSSADPLEGYGLPQPKNQRQPRAQTLSRRHDLRYYAARLKQFGLTALGKPPLAKPARHRYRSSGYVDFAHGLGGVSIRPEFLDQDDFNIPEVIWAVDDIWLSGAFERKGIGIWAEKTVPLPPAGDAARKSSLAESVIEDHDRRAADLACITYMQKRYGIWTDAET